MPTIGPPEGKILEIDIDSQKRLNVFYHEYCQISGITKREKT